MKVYPNFPEHWDKAEKEEWIADYISGKPVLFPVAEHEDGGCEYCDALRVLMTEAHNRGDEK